MIKKKSIPTENEECKTWFEFAQYDNTLKHYLIKIVNEGKRESWQGKRLVDIGLRKGVPDYFLPIPNKRWHGLFIEMKRIDQRKRKKRDSQEQWMDRLTKSGYLAVYAYGASDAIRIWKDYMNDIM